MQCFISICIQDHYDFGMRAIKSVLIMAGQKKRVFAYNQAIERIEESSPTNDVGLLLLY